MNNFDFYIKTKLYFGKDKHLETGKILASFGAKKVLIFIGQGSVRKNGLLDEVTNTIKQENIDFRVVEGIRPNPTIDLVKKFLIVAKEYQPDFLLAIGGGSVIDTAKLVSVGYYYDGDPFDFNLKKAVPVNALPLGVILTISASGSEMSASCVIQDDKTMIKSGFLSEFNRPAFAIENPELTYSVSPAQTAYGIVDIMMHTMERYFMPSCEIEPADRFAEGLLKSVIEAGKKVVINPKDYEARAVIMLMSSLSHNGLTSIGKTPFLLVHKLEHALSGVYPDVAHGAGLSVLFPAWADYYVNIDTDKFDLFARNVWGCNNPDKLANGKEGIKCLREFFKSIGAPITLEELNIKDLDIEKVVNVLTDGGKKTVPHYLKPLDAEIARIIYESCVR